MEYDFFKKYIYCWYHKCRAFMANHLTLLPSKLVCLDDILRYLILKGQNRVLTQRIVRISLCPLNDDIVSF